MNWIFIALLTPLLHGFANILDNYLTGSLFKSLMAIIFFTTLSNVLFLPLVFFVEIPGPVPPGLLPFFLLISLIDVLYLYPYYKALQTEDTSIVSSLFALGKIFVPLLAFFLVGEVLTFTQYAGFFIIILGSALLTLKGLKKFSFRASFFLMLLCSLLLSAEAVMYKYLFDQVSWSTGFVWTSLFSFSIAFFFLLFPKYRHVIQMESIHLRKVLPVFLLEEFLTFGGAAAFTYAVSLTSVTLVKSVGALQPLFVLSYAVLFNRIFPALFREKLDFRSIIKKGILFAVIAFGIVLVV